MKRIRFRRLDGEQVVEVDVVIARTEDWENSPLAASADWGVYRGRRRVLALSFPAAGRDVHGAEPSARGARIA